MNSEHGADEGWGAHPEIPRPWSDAALRIADLAASRVFVFGPTDVGKSTFCGLLLKAMCDTRQEASLLDADLGQKMIGPPACVTLGNALPEGVIGLSGLAFVGTTDPLRGWRGLINGIRRLSTKVSSGPLVINTGGLVHGPGLRLKAEKVKALEPDLLVLIGEVRALEPDWISHTQVIELPPSPHARRKPEGQRRAARRHAFRSYFQNSKETLFDLSKVALGSPDDSDLLLRNRLLIGLSDDAGEDLGLGIVTAFDAQARTVTCLTPIDVSAVVQLRWGNLLLGEDFSENTLAVAL
ncbi:Clp1/GlmU family protein [Microvirga lenta]|uniref:Clp1/GlmU family protein n=1 Tax=Microvirga lenta TaxID=2881337 RepID=UPI001CFFDDC9|nr:Clp1/GlmU family protein [Microvirga lenta]MCB5176478.1 polynucleotide 5'-hydroxyl-kinase [Microvirga lenta]